MEGIGFCLAASRVYYYYFYYLNTVKCYLNDSFSFKAWHVIVGNALRLGSINSIGDFILFLAKCLVTLTVGSLALFTLRSNSELHFHAIPIIIICIFTFFVAHCVISLHEVKLFNNLAYLFFLAVVFYFFTISLIGFYICLYYN